jgi:hypothetical protein
MLAGISMRGVVSNTLLFLSLKNNIAMKKKSTKKLELRKSTISSLDKAQSARIKGGSDSVVLVCCITDTHSFKFTECEIDSKCVICYAPTVKNSCKYTDCLIDSKCVLCYEPTNNTCLFTAC